MKKELSIIKTKQRRVLLYVSKLIAVFIQNERKCFCGGWKPPAASLLFAVIKDF